MKGESHSVVSDSLQPHGLYNSWNSPGQNTGVGNLSEDRPNPGIKPRSPELQVDSLPSEPQRKPPYLQFLVGALPPHPHPACLGHRDLLCGFFVQGYTPLILTKFLACFFQYLKKKKDKQ